MTREEAKEILTHNWTRVDNPNYSESELDEAFFMAIEALSADADAVSRDVYNKRTKADEEIIDSYREKLANCHRKILRLLDFNNTTESPNDVIESQNDVIVVVRCKDCRFYWGNLSEDDTDEMYGECRWDSDEMPNADDFCSYGERREP